MKKLLPAALAACLLLTACGGGKTVSETGVEESTTAAQTSIKIESAASKAASEQTDASASTDTTAETSETAATTTTASQTATYTFTDLSKYSFEFCSGAGGWSTNFTIEADGSFSGTYHDSDMGSTGDGYPNGTMYVSSFKGHFADLKAIDANTYEMTLKDITYANKAGTEEIADDTKYIYSDAYGLTDTKRFLVYLPGTPVSSFNDEIASWIHWSYDGQDTISTPVIVNEDQQEGIYSYERTSPAEEAEMNYNTYLESYNYYEEEVQNSNTQLDMEENSKKQFEIADELLNSLWATLKANADDAAFQKILTEQRAWNKTKESNAKSAYDTYGSGSLANTSYYQSLASQTIERCKELLAYIQGL